MRKIHKKGIYTSILDRFQNEEVFHASQLQQNWTKRMVRMFGIRQNNRCYAQCFSRTIGTIRSVVSFSARSETNGERPYKKSSRLSSDNTGYCQHEQRSRSDSRIKKTTQLSLNWLVWRSHNWKWYFAVNQISELDSTQWHHQKSTEEHASGNRVGGPRLGGRNQDGHGMTKSEDFFFFEKLRISCPRSGNYCVCDGVCTHTPCRTHIFFALFPCVTYRHEHAWLKVFAVCMSYLSISPSPFSCFIRRLCCSRTVNSTPRSRLHLFLELYQTQKRGSSAPPHMRRGVWLPGQSHAFNTRWPQRTRRVAIRNVHRDKTDECTSD